MKFTLKVYNFYYLIKLVVAMSQFVLKICKSLNSTLKI
jgi:hypothetical protein